MLSEIKITSVEDSGLALPKQMLCNLYLLIYHIDLMIVFYEPGNSMWKFYL